MRKKSQLLKKVDNYLLEHNKTKFVLHEGFAIIMMALSALFFSYGFCSFISPHNTDGNVILELATGGMSGLSQIILRILHIMGVLQNDSLDGTLQPLIYFVLNIPIFFVAWKGIGKRFAIYTIFNVIFVTLFNWVFKETDAAQLAKIFDLKDDILARALFAGILTGLSSATAFKMDGSAGGIDVIACYFANKKSTSIGKYALAFNSIVITTFTILSSIQMDNHNAYQILLYTIVYLFVAATVVDALSVRNKKNQIQIITANDQLPSILISRHPHGCTVVDAKGAFSGEKRKIIYMAVSSSETNSVIETVNENDENAFINVVAIQRLHGKFYIRPIK